MSRVKAGIVGCGAISSVYLANGKRFPPLEIVACADLVAERAKRQAEAYGVRACSVEELLADPEIGLVINLTVPAAHADVSIRALEAGKHVYSEKPLAVTLDEGRRILEMAARKGLRVGCAPDTFLGGGLQTAIRLVRSGAIGEPVGACAFMIGRGHEHWHPDPEFYYKAGGGPLFDMGPYYLTALVAMLGPIRRVTGSARASFPERVILSEPKRGQKVRVEVPTHVAGVLDFEAGPIGSVVMSFDAFGGTSLPCIEIYGSEATLVAPNPNHFGGAVRYRRRDESEWKEIPPDPGYVDDCRGLGAADMAEAILTGRRHRADGELAFHVLEAMVGLHEAAERGSHYEMQSRCVVPEPMEREFIPF